MKSGQLIYLITPTYFTRPREHIFFSESKLLALEIANYRQMTKSLPRTISVRFLLEVLDPLLGQIHSSADTSTHL